MPCRTRRIGRLPALVAGLVLCVTTPSTEAQPATTAESGLSVTFGDGRITFVAPRGFTEFTAEELAAKYPRPGAPRRAVGNARRTTSIAYDLLDTRAPTNDLDEARKVFVEIYKKTFPTLKWVATDVRSIAGRTWAYLEFTAPAVDQELHNIVLVSVHAGRVLMFNFNSTGAEFPRVEQALRTSMNTIKTTP